MTRRGLIYSIAGLSLLGWAGIKHLTGQVERLAIDPNGERHVYHDGWIIRK